MKTTLCLLLSPLLFNMQDQLADDEKIILKESGIKNAYPRLSKDNKQVLYQTNRSGKWQLEFIHVDDKAVSPLLKDTFNNNFPDWSPDNEWIAFVSDRDGNEEIYIIKRDGSGLTRLTNNKARDIHPYFSPDGKSLLFNSDRDNGSFDVYRITLTSKKTERITDTPENETCAHYSPDMSEMVFLKNDEHSDNVFTYSFNAKTFKNVSSTPTVTDGWPVYSADGKWIYYSSRESGIYCIYKIKPDGTGKTKITDTKTDEDVRVNIAPDGSKIIFNKEYDKTISIWSAKIK